MRSMKHRALPALVAAVCAASGFGCGGRISGVPAAVGEETSTVAALQRGAATGRAYVGATNRFAVGERPVAVTFDLIGGARLELEVATLDASPVRFELWQAHVDGSATLSDPVDAPSGFALDRIAADEDARWVLVFPAATPRAQALVHMDCVGGDSGCTPDRQPGESCPAGWSCDVGLACALPVGACGPLAAAGTCIVPPADCPIEAAAVCGCDGHTYASECAARIARAPILHPGSCDG
jgi:hypothetical protein